MMLKLFFISILLFSTLVSASLWKSEGITLVVESNSLFATSKKPFRKVKIEREAGTDSSVSGLVYVKNKLKFVTLNRKRVLAVLNPKVYDAFVEAIREKESMVKSRGTDTSDLEKPEDYLKKMGTSAEKLQREKDRVEREPFADIERIESIYDLEGVDIPSLPSSPVNDKLKGKSSFERDTEAGEIEGQAPSIEDDDEMALGNAQLDLDIKTPASKVTPESSYPSRSDLQKQMEEEDLPMVELGESLLPQRSLEHRPRQHSLSGMYPRHGMSSLSARHNYPGFRQSRTFSNELGYNHYHNKPVMD